MATGELGRLQQRLERGGYSVVVIDPRELPSRAPLASAGERRRKDLPKEGRPELGLRVELAPDAVGLVYRYSSSELATAIAPSFLGWARTGGDYGCGRNVFFARRGLGRDRASRVTSGWLADTTAALKRLGDCAQAFMDIT